MTRGEEEHIQKLRLSQAHLDDARRHFQTGLASPRTCDQIKAGLLWAIEAWLLKHGHEPNFGNGWHSMRSQFFSVASENLKSEIAECLFAIARLEALDTEFDGEAITYKSPAYSSPGWQEALWACLVQTEEILEAIAMDVEADVDEEDFRRR